MSADPKRIFIVDDEASFTRLLKAALENAGSYRVEYSNHATQALAAARAFQPDVVLLDVIMPDGSGAELATQFKADEHLKAAPIIFLTAAVPKHAAAREGTLAGYPCLAKPITLEALIACLERQLGTESQKPSA